MEQIIIQNQTHITLASSFEILICVISRGPTACQEDPKGVNYRGNLSQTITDHTCQAWNSQFPHRHDMTPANYPNAGLDENYCRNPDIDYTAWCFTTNHRIRWKYCAVGYFDPKCQGSVVVLRMWAKRCSKLINIKMYAFISNDITLTGDKNERCYVVVFVKHSFKPKERKSHCT